MLADGIDQTLEMIALIGSLLARSRFGLRSFDPFEVGHRIAQIHSSGGRILSRDWTNFGVETISSDTAAGVIA
ncbi:MAG TPA: hypothetical protein VHB77_21410 [Planctomycetaceae bacterium]|nr:hypothetical protein [Planctomycetaceae bacterium]